MTARLPPGAVVDEALHAKIAAAVGQSPPNFDTLGVLLREATGFVEYDAALAFANDLVLARVDEIVSRGDWLSAQGKVSAARVQGSLLQYARVHLDPSARPPIFRVLARSSDQSLRRRALAAIREIPPDDVALPATPDGVWDASGWSAGLRNRPLSRHRRGTRRQEELGLPPLETVGELRKLLDIRSPGQLRFLLIATADDGPSPYRKFTIPKRSGAERLIAAPGAQLKGAQRRILSEILEKVPVHPAAHGFVSGRSTRTHAEAHQHRRLVVKFDITDFFPTIHQYRVMGLFCSLGYDHDDGRFRAQDEARSVAAVLARLCTYTDDSEAWNAGVLPQGAPTSPAISNLVCRRLDNRLSGVAHRLGGSYTRYADDLAFSFDELPREQVGRLRWWVDQIVSQEGFRINHEKFRVIANSQRQEITGIVVNEALHVPREDRRRFRAVLHRCRTKGLEEAAAGNPKFRAWLLGYASYLNMVQPEMGAAILTEVREMIAKEGR